MNFQTKNWVLFEINPKKQNFLTEWACNHFEYQLPLGPVVAPETSKSPIAVRDQQIRQYDLSLLTHIFWSWLAKCWPPLKLKVLTVSVVWPQKYCVQPSGAKLLKLQLYCVILIVQLLVTVVVVPILNASSLHISEESKYTKQNKNYINMFSCT